MAEIALPPTTLDLSQPAGLLRGWRQYDSLIAVVVAATQIILTVKGDRVCRLNAVHLDITTDSTAGGRVVTLDILDPDGNLVVRQYGPGTVAPSISHATIDFWRGANYNAVTSANIMQASLYDDFLPPGWQVRARLGSAGATDQWNLARLIYETYLLGPDGYLIGRQSDPLYLR